MFEKQCDAEQQGLKETLSMHWFTARMPATLGRLGPEAGPPLQGPKSLFLWPLRVRICRKLDGKQRQARIQAL